MLYERITTNIAGVKTRREKLEGRNYIVVPTVMLTVGVHTGSQGPLFYGEDELSRNPLTWNHKPIIVYHPMLEGEGVSACVPAVLERQKIGIILNSGFDGRAASESWLEEEKTRKVDNRVLEAIESGRTVEVSTGLFQDPEARPGEWRGQKYVAVVRNIQPDHLAILPDAVGACSIEKGAGLLRNSMPVSLLNQQLRDALAQYRYPLSGAWYVSDVYADTFVWNQDGKLYRLPYTREGDTIKLFGEPEEVERVAEYRVRTNNSTGDPMTLPATNPVVAPPANPAPAPSPTNVLNPPPAVSPIRKDQVDKLIAGQGWTEADRTFLSYLPDEGFEKITRYSTVRSTPPPLPTPPAPAPAPVPPAAVPVPAPVAPALNSLTPQQWLDYMNPPPAVRQMLTNGLAAAQAEREQLVTVIVANRNNKFTKEWLMQVPPVEELRGMAALAGNNQPVNNYGGQAAVPMFGPVQPVQNAVDLDKIVLVVPSMDDPPAK